MERTLSSGTEGSNPACSSGESANHHRDRLMAEVPARISDRRVLGLIPESLGASAHLPKKQWLPRSVVDIEAETGRFRLSPLGRRAVDPARERDANAKAFLTVPLYNAVFEKYKGGVLPPAAALEREIVEIGVAEKQKHTARLVLERSAQYAGFFEHGKDRLVMPGVASDEHREPAKTDESEHRGSRGKGSGGDGEKPRHPLIEGMSQSLPFNGETWTLEEAADWLHAAAYNLRFAYKLKGKITVDIKVEQPTG